MDEQRKQANLSLQNNTEDNEALYEHYRFVVDKGQSPLRIDKYLVIKTEGVSRNRIQNAIAAGMRNTG